MLVHFRQKSKFRVT